MEGIKQIVDREIEEYKKKYQDDWMIPYFGNFQLKLPGPQRKKLTKYKNGTSTNKFSDLYNDKSFEEFFAAIDGVLKECEIFDEVKETQRYWAVVSIFSPQSDLKDAISYRLLDMAYEAYIKLRELGYNRFDLTA